MPIENLLRNRFESLIAGAISEAKHAADMKHSGLVGTVREILVERMLRPALPPEIRFGTGKLLDKWGSLSCQTDVVVYSPHILPPGLYDERTGLFPVESCLYAIEVKSKLTASTLDEAIENAQSNQMLTPTNTFHYYANPKSKPGQSPTQNHKSGTPLPINALFAFGSDLSGTGKSELERYLEKDSGDDHAIPVICVVGKGYWYTTKNGWRYYAASESFDEVLSFLAGISNTIPGLLSAKGRPQFGQYLIDETGGELIE